MHVGSGAGTNLGVGAPAWRKSSRLKYFLVVPLHLFCTPSPAICKGGARAPVPYGVGHHCMYLGKFPT